jgi:hypothetical protein
MLRRTTRLFVLSGRDKTAFETHEKFQLFESRNATEKSFHKPLYPAPLRRISGKITASVENCFALPPNLLGIMVRQNQSYIVPRSGRSILPQA